MGKKEEQPLLTLHEKEVTDEQDWVPAAEAGKETHHPLGEEHQRMDLKPFLDQRWRNKNEAEGSAQVGMSIRQEDNFSWYNAYTVIREIKITV